MSESPDLLLLGEAGMRIGVPYARLHRLAARQRLDLPGVRRAGHFYVVEANRLSELKAYLVEHGLVRMASTAPGPAG